MRRAILERWRTEDGEESLAAIRRHHIVNKLSPMKVHARKNWLKTIRGFMQFAVMKNMRADDPTHGIKFATGKSRGHMTWGEEQIAQFRTRHPIGTVARVAIELLLNIAARRHDAHLIGRQHLREGKLRWRPNKTLRTTGKMLSIRVLPELQAALDAIPANDSLTFLVTDYGKPFASAAAFGNKFGDWCDDAGLPEILCDDGRARNYRAHGLRKTACRRLAHAGCTASEIMAVSGHATLAQLQVYLDEVEQDIMADAAMGKLMRQVVGR
jgi:integrase